MKDVWHQIEDGTFDKDGKTFEYVIEQSKNKPIRKGTKNIRMRVVRMRVVQEKPEVEKIRTRYDPQISVMGDKGAVAPAWCGFDMKHLRPSIFLFSTLTFMGLILVDMVFGTNMSIAIINKAGSMLDFGITLPATVVSVATKISVVVLFVAFLYVPMIYSYVKRWKWYRLLKKEGVSYADTQ